MLYHVYLIDHNKNMIVDTFVNPLFLRKETHHPALSYHVKLNIHDIMCWVNPADKLRISFLNPTYIYYNI